MTTSGYSSLRRVDCCRCLQIQNRSCRTFVIPQHTTFAATKDSIDIRRKADNDSLRSEEDKTHAPQITLPRM